MNVQAFKLETLIHVAFVIYVLTDVFELDLLKDLLCWLCGDGGRSGGLDDWERVEDLLAPVELDMLFTLDFFGDIVDADFMICEMEEVRLLTNVLLEVVLLLCQYIIQLRCEVDDIDLVR